jgi:hypothetical protein
MAKTFIPTTLGYNIESEIISGSGHKTSACLVPGTTGGVTPNHYVLAATNNARTLKGSPGQLYYLIPSNKTVGGYDFWVKVYDKASNPNPASDVPKIAVLVPAGLSQPLMFENGIEFTLGIAMLVVQGAADTDNTAIAAAADGVVFTGIK